MAEKCPTGICRASSRYYEVEKAKNVTARVKINLSIISWVVLPYTDDLLRLLSSRKYHTSRILFIDFQLIPELSTWAERLGF